MSTTARRRTPADYFHRDDCTNCSFGQIKGLNAGD
jgi:hypothetical protein